MKIWQLMLDMQSLRIGLENREEDSHLYIEHFRGISMNSWWKPVNVVTLKEKENVDFTTYMPNIPLFSRIGKGYIEPLIKDLIEFLPVNHSKYDLFLGNVINVVDSIDYSRSVLRNSLPGSFAGFDDIYFSPKKLDKHNIHIFKVPELVLTHVFVSDQFREQIIKSKLLEFKFNEVWDSEYTIEINQDRELKYAAFMEEMEQHNGVSYTWEQTCEKVKEGWAMRSLEWKMQLNKKGEIMLGRLDRDCNYRWNYSYGTPPALLSSEWFETDKSDVNK